VDALAGGDIIALPTDTVYGLAADPFHTGAADRLFTVKGRQGTSSCPSWSLTRTRRSPYAQPCPTLRAGS